MKIYIENWSGSPGDLYVDGGQFTIPVGRHEFTLDENLQMNGQSTVMWDFNNAMQTEFMDDGDILIADQYNQAVFISVEPVPEVGGTLVPIEVFFEGFGIGGVVAATMMILVMVKKVLGQGPLYD